MPSLQLLILAHNDIKSIRGLEDSAANLLQLDVRGNPLLMLKDDAPELSVNMPNLVWNEDLRTIESLSKLKELKLLNHKKDCTSQR